MPDMYDGTSLFGLSPFGGSHEHHWCPSPVSALTPELDLPDVKCQFFDDHADLTQDYHHQQQHLEDHPHPSHYVSQLTPPSDRGALSVCEQSGSGNITTTASVYLDLDYSNFVERKVFDIENMETRSGLNANRGCESGNNSVFNFGPYDNQWQRPACLPARKSLPYNTRSSSDLWKHISPENWSPEQVMDWLYSVASRYNIDHAIRGEALRGTTGDKLCRMKLQDFAVLGVEGYAFNIYEELCKLQQKFLSQGPSDEGFGNVSFQEPWPGHSTSPPHPPHGFIQQLQGPSTEWSPAAFPKLAMKTEAGVPLKRKRGRPRKYPKPDPMVPKQPKQRGRKPGQRSKGHHLWEFLRDLLADSAHGQLIRWEDRQNGVFRIVDSKAVSDLWGAQKKNKSMTYEKLSRAIRFCQKESVGYFSRLPDTATYPKKLCFKFGPKTWGWQLS